MRLKKQKKEAVNYSGGLSGREKKLKGSAMVRGATSQLVHGVPVLKRHQKQKC